MIVLLGWNAAPARSAESPIGAHSMLQLNSPYPFMQAMFAEAAAMHASAIRVDVAPALVFIGPSQPPDFTGLDEVVALATAYHLRVVADLITIPWWISDCPGPRDTAWMSRCGTDDLVDYGGMITAIVRRAEPVIHDWEIWNEPDVGSFFSGTPAQYAWMLRGAHDAIKAVDPAADVLLGGISGPWAQSWLAQVFATVGPDAAHAFDIANIHERNALDALAGDVESWKQFLAGYGFAGPLWVTEHGYPSDPAFQYDPSYELGPASQAAFLGASIPTLIDAGAEDVFVTERDNLTGQYASEGVVGGDVLDPPPTDPEPIEKPAYAVVRALSDCYVALGRDCPGPTLFASPSPVAIPSTRLRSSTISNVAIFNPGTGPVKLGAVTIAQATPNPISVRGDGCSNEILEPDHPCKITLRFAPVLGGAVTATLNVPSDTGQLSVPVTAVSPSVSSLTSPQLLRPSFTTTDGADGVGHTQQLVLSLSNPLNTTVRVASASLSGRDASQFAIEPDDCTDVHLAPGGRCLVYVLFKPTHARTESAVLSLYGDGTPLQIALHATAFALPSVTHLTATGSRACFAPGSRNRVLVVSNQPSTIRWRAAAHRQVPARCVSSGRDRTVLPESGHTSASGSARARPDGPDGTRNARFVAKLTLPVGGRRGLRPGTYRLTVTPVDSHGAGRSRSLLVTVTR